MRRGASFLESQNVGLCRDHGHWKTLRGQWIKKKNYKFYNNHICKWNILYLQGKTLPERHAKTTKKPQNLPGRETREISRVAKRQNTASHDDLTIQIGWEKLIFRPPTHPVGQKTLFSVCLKIVRKWPAFCSGHSLKVGSYQCHRGLK